MTDSAISIRGLGKRYRLGRADQKCDTLTGAAISAITSPVQNLRRLRELTRFSADEEATIWALRDFDLEIRRGEVMGIIGRNGAGKSTLLKILSRITEPSTGSAVLDGKVASLLEVGTGFHPDLTGRENVYLNGTVLGMSRREIDRKFDEIVAFSEVERFLDTPVKRYSSGMMVRLAFAVAAHLEPQILLVDEVLAVGDVAFQRKCLGKMGDVAGEGRTVLFVSHNMAAVRSLCDRAVFLADGRKIVEGTADEVADQYLMDSVHSKPDASLETDLFEVNEITISGRSTPILKTFDDAQIRVALTPKVMVRDLGIYVSILSPEHHRLMGVDLRDFALLRPIPAGETRVVCFDIERFPLLGGQYFLELHVKDMAVPVVERLEELIPFEVADTSIYGGHRLGSWYGSCALDVTVRVDEPNQLEAVSS